MPSLSISFRRGLLILTAALAAGCSSEGFKIGRHRSAGQRLESFKVEADDWARLGYRQDWTGFPRVTGSLPIQFIVPQDDAVAVLEAGSQVSILEPTTGNLRAAAELANPLTRFVGLERDGERVYAVSEAEVFTVDVQTGVLRDRKKIEQVVSTEPTQYAGLLIFGTPRGEVMAHQSTGSISGVKRWGFGMGASVRGKPALLGSAVGAVAQNGKVAFLDAESGGLIGTSSIFSGVETNPVADNNIMFVASLDQSIYAFSPHGGSMLWRKREAHPLRVQPTAFGGKLFCSIPQQGLVAFDGATGNQLWNCKDFNDGVVIGVNRGRLLVFNGTEAALIDPERGDLLERAKLPEVTMLKPDKFVDGNLYVVSKSGVVAKFRRR